MTTFYPNQPAPSFLKKYARNAYNRVRHDAHVNVQNTNDEASLALQVRRSENSGKKLFNQEILSASFKLRGKKIGGKRV